MEQARQRFGFLLDVGYVGAPPHGGIALGLDRLAMILAGTTNIGDAHRFPQEPEGLRPHDRMPPPSRSRQLRIGVVRAEPRITASKGEPSPWPHRQRA